jgi:hypothetical protein
MRIGMDGKPYMPGGSRDFAIQQKQFGESMDKVRQGDMSDFSGQRQNPDGTVTRIVNGVAQASAPQAPKAEVKYITTRTPDGGVSVVRAPAQAPATPTATPHLPAVQGGSDTRMSGPAPMALPFNPTPTQTAVMQKDVGSAAGRGFSVDAPTQVAAAAPKVNNSFLVTNVPESIMADRRKRSEEAKKSMDALKTGVSNLFGGYRPSTEDRQREVSRKRLKEPMTLPDLNSAPKIDSGFQLPKPKEPFDLPTLPASTGSTRPRASLV